MDICGVWTIAKTCSYNILHFIIMTVYVFFVLSILFFIFVDRLWLLNQELTYIICILYLG